MRTLTPSLLVLVLVSFAVVALPLVTAIVTAIARVDTLASDSRRALATVKENTDQSRELADRVRLMERSARQYQALLDIEYRALYEDHRLEALTTLASLAEQTTDADLQSRIAAAQRSESAAHASVDAIGGGATDVDLESAFAQVRDDVGRIVAAYDSVARDMGEAMPERARQLQRVLLIQALLVIPLSGGLAVLFVVLILRPMRQLDSSIRSLGGGGLNEPLRISGTRDLEELGRRLEWLRLRLIELEHQKVRFLRNVSHELKTPLTNIREGAELLAGNAHDTAADKQRITQIVRENSIRLQAMIEELLRFGTEAEQNATALREPVRLDRVVEAAVAANSAAFTAREIEVRTRLASVTVQGHPRQLRAIVDNLLSNAGKYCSKAGRIDVDLREVGDAVELDVRDTGPGVRPRDRARLFEWFFTGPRPPDAIVPGSGMGLAIAQEYAKQHGGCIHLIDSSHGAHFRFSLQDKATGQSR